MDRWEVAKKGTNHKYLSLRGSLKTWLLAGLFVCVVRKEEDSMIISSPEPEVQILVDRNPVKTSFEEWAISQEQ